MFIIAFPKLFAKNFRGLAVFPIIFVKEKMMKENKVLINHEKIHIRQQLELLWLPFFLWYGIEFLLRWIKYGNANKAYVNICFEKEAYANENNLNYLKDRKLWSFYNYL